MSQRKTRLNADGLPARVPVSATLYLDDYRTLRERGASVCEYVADAVRARMAGDRLEATPLLRLAAAAEHAIEPGDPDYDGDRMNATLTRRIVGRTVFLPLDLWERLSEKLVARADRDRWVRGVLEAAVEGLVTPTAGRAAETPTPAPADPVVLLGQGEYARPVELGPPLL